jgi:hypothetical protein
MSGLLLVYVNIIGFHCSLLGHIMHNVCVIAQKVET